MGIFKNIARGLGDVVGEFTGAADVERAAAAGQAGINQLTGERAEAMRGAQSQMMAGVSPYEEQIRSLVMGNTPIESVPGYNAMSSARREGIGDMMTQMGGAGKFFSGTTGQQAANISGGMENELMQQQLRNLQMGMGSAMDVGNIRSGGVNDITNLLMGGNQQANQYAMQGAQARQESMGDLLGAVGNIAGAGINPLGFMGGGINAARGMMTPRTETIGSGWGPR